MTSWLASSVSKLNPVQVSIASEAGTNVSSPGLVSTYDQYYRKLEVLNRSVNMVVDDTVEIPFSVKADNSSPGMSRSGIKMSTVTRLLNVAPNPFQDIHSFRRLLVMDMILEGNAFIYFDGEALYHLPARNVEILPDVATYVKAFKYVGFGQSKEFLPSQVIHIKDNSSGINVYRGESRIQACVDTLKLLTSMRTFQNTFFDNGAVPGLVITSPEMISPRVKERMKADWSQQYSPKAGGKKPMILDSGMKLDPISNSTFKELDFQEASERLEKLILKAMGVPPILLDSGNNANIRPNHRVYYLETIIPIIKKFAAAYGAFFGYTIVEDGTGIPALQPELSDLASYLTSLVNGGVITGNEARIELGYQPMEGHDEIRIPANVAGSAANPSEGGRPPDKKNSEG